MRSFVRVAAAVVVVCVGGCSSAPQSVGVADKQFRYVIHAGPGGVVYSPNGEPLTGGDLGSPSCADALTAWFNRLDTNHDGFIDQAEFTADARTQFTRMDRDHDGAIYPLELSAFRAPYTASHKNPGFGGDQVKPDESQLKAHPPDFSDPVMSADTNLDYRVTLDEMIAQAQEMFRVLDRNHDGKIDKSEILSTCPAPVKK